MSLSDFDQLDRLLAGGLASGELTVVFGQSLHRGSVFWVNDVNRTFGFRRLPAGNTSLHVHLAQRLIEQGYQFLSVEPI